MRLKTLNGAPECKNLDFHESKLFNPEHTESAFQAFILGERVTPVDDSSIAIKWRHVEVQPGRLKTGWSQPHPPKDKANEHVPEISFAMLDTATASSAANAASFRDTEHFSDDEPDYVQHSLILHDTLMSSQIALDGEHASEPEETTISSSSFLTTSFTTHSSILSNEQSQGQVLHLPPNSTITSLANVPSAQYIRSISPQTPTPTFIGVLTRPIEQREVYVRKGGYRMQLLEIVIADDTHAGFKVTFWFQPPKRNNRAHDAAQDLLRQTLEGLQTGDVVLLRHIVLAIFRDNVYGQSLNPRISKARTSVENLMGIKTISPVAANEKFSRVRAWAKVHVASDSRASLNRKRGSDVQRRPTTRYSKAPTCFDDTLPPDTLEAV